MTITEMRTERKNGKIYGTVNKIEDTEWALQNYADVLTQKYLHQVPNMRIETVQNYNGTETVKVYHGNGYRTVYEIKR